MNKLAIVVIAYNRVDSLTRLLNSLAAALIEAETPLIISIDRARANQDVRTFAEAFHWPFGTKEVRYQDRHLGLVNHYLACGDLTKEYGAIILLEDDLAVARPFYQFAAQAWRFYRDEPAVAGISLNSLWFNGYTHYQFTPLLDDNDLFFLPIAWYQGQLLWSKQWLPFREWLASGQGIIRPDDPLHPSFQAFAADEWFPAYTKYLVTTGRYFAFPRQSLSSNFGDPGTHFGKRSDHFQVPWQQFRTRFRFQPLSDSLAVYDSFYELEVSRLKLLAPQLETFDLTVDLHGSKPAHLRPGQWVISSQPSRAVEKSYGLQRRPIEANIIEAVPGSGLYLTENEALRDDKLANWQRLYRLDRYFRRQRPAGILPRLLGRFLE